MAKIPSFFRDRQHRQHFADRLKLNRCPSCQRDGALIRNGLLKGNNKRRLAFSKAHANECWQADTLFGPYVANGKTKTQAKLIAFIDDASRVLCHGEFFFCDNIANLIGSFQTAIYKRGIPEQIYVDNGSN